MLTKGAVEDIIAWHLFRREPGGKPAVKKVPELKKRTFLSDWDLRRLYTPGARKITVPADALLSPLSMDWLDYDGIEVVRR